MVSDKLTFEQMLHYVDHTVLKATTAWEDIDVLCRQAVASSTASVCIPPNYVKPAYDKYGDKVAICTVIGFPLGYSKTEAKLAEARAAIADGATELDMVINICDVKNKNYQQVEDEIVQLKKLCGDKKLAEARAAIADGATELDMVINICDVKNKNYQQVEDEIVQLKKLCGDNILKVIIETCYLTEDEKIKLCEIVTRAGADYIKTSTGFGTAGAQLEDIRLFKQHIGNGVKIKAAGGIRTVEALEQFIDAGCDRIGSSAVVPEI